MGRDGEAVRPGPDHHGLAVISPDRPGGHGTPRLQRRRNVQNAQMLQRKSATTQRLSFGNSTGRLGLTRRHHMGGARARSRDPSLLQPVSGPEDYDDGDETEREEDQRHADADADRDVAFVIEAPAKAADQINYRIEQSRLPPEWRQHRDGIEAAAEKGQRRDDE